MTQSTDQTPKWYQEAIIYQLHIRAFFDSNKDGSGDFRGLVQKLDYLQNLGITAIWILPFYPSPLRDDGYDISDYTSVNPIYGQLQDFKTLMKEAHRRNIRVITELVMNHTSDQHPWFQRARQAKHGSKWRDFYVWSDTIEKYQEARIIFKDFESSNWTWDPIAQAYYWHRFYSHQPDLNFDNPLVQKAVLQWLDFWFEMGVDGLRLDAVPYLFERDGTNCENLPETHEFLKKLRRHIDEKYQNRMLLAEANQWPEDAVAYFGKGDECHMAFHFPLMPRMFMSLKMEDRFPLIDIWEQTPAIPESSQWSIFLRNHDELTLEMVTDEERDYMYRVYAEDPQARINLGIRRRLAPLLSNNRKKIELMNALLFAIPGTPVIYYGDEIGMGDNFYLGDRNAVRTPMQWSANSNAGFSAAHPHRLFLPVIIDPEYHYESVNVEIQENNPESLLWWMKRLIALRKRYPTLALGKITFLYPENSKVLAFTSTYEQETLLIVVNLSRFPEFVELDLSPWIEFNPLELFGQNKFPTITNNSYFLSLGPHNFYWFLLQPKDKEHYQHTDKQKAYAEFSFKGNWENLIKDSLKSQLEKTLKEYLPQQRWYGNKLTAIKRVEITENIPIATKGNLYILLFLEVTDIKDETTIYLLSVTFIAEEDAIPVLEQFPQGIIGRLNQQNGYLIDACYHSDYARTLIWAVDRGQKFKGNYGVAQSQRTHAFRELYDKNQVVETSPVKLEQSNTSLLYDKMFVLKCYRRASIGSNPDIEIGRYLTEEAHFPNVPDLAGSYEYVDKKGNTISLLTVHQYIPHETNGWDYTVNNINRFFEKMLTMPKEQNNKSILTPTLSQFFNDRIGIPEEVQSILSNTLHSAELLGKHTAELHIALSDNTRDPLFVPESFTSLNQRAIYQSIRSLTGRTLNQLRKSLKNLSDQNQPLAQKVLESADRLDDQLRKIIKRKISGALIRCHGDLHLGQVLFTGKDFIFVDFEGEPARSMSERRIKKSPLVDVAGMLRSFDYAVQTSLYGATTLFREEDLQTLEFWGTFWYRWNCIAFLQSYFETAKNQYFLPKNQEELSILMNTTLIEKAIYEINYELNNRPDLLHIPCRGLIELLS